jgi:hypothetical protein
LLTGLNGGLLNGGLLRIGERGGMYPFYGQFPFLLLIVLLILLLLTISFGALNIN